MFWLVSFVNIKQLDVIFFTKFYCIFTYYFLQVNYFFGYFKQWTYFYLYHQSQEKKNQNIILWVKKKKWVVVCYCLCHESGQTLDILLLLSMEA